MMFPTLHRLFGWLTSLALFYGATGLALWWFPPTPMTGPTIAGSDPPTVRFQPPQTVFVVTLPRGPG